MEYNYIIYNIHILYDYAYTKKKEHHAPVPASIADSGMHDAFADKSLVEEPPLAKALDFEVFNGFLALLLKSTHKYMPNKYRNHIP
jgi:hypothetical protein